MKNHLQSYQDNGTTIAFCGVTQAYSDKETVHIVHKTDEATCVLCLQKALAHFMLICWTEHPPKRREEEFNLVGDWLLKKNTSVFVFPEIETGEVFWLIKQPVTDPIGKGRTLVEALENAKVWKESVNDVV